MNTDAGRPALRRAATALLAIGVFTVALAQTERASSDAVFEGLPDAEKLLAGVIAALPVEPIRVLAEVQSRKPGGKLDRLHRLEIDLQAVSGRYEAEYRLFDAFGGGERRMQIHADADGTPAYRFFSGDPLRAQALPDLLVPIEGTDISWSDLMFGFLWWEGARTVGAESIKKRFCYIIDIPVPKDASADYDAIRIWIDPRFSVLLRAETYGSDGNVIRRLDVKSFKKIGEQWVIKNIETKTYPSRHRTLLRVRSVGAARTAR